MTVAHEADPGIQKIDRRTKAGRAMAAAERQEQAGVAVQSMPRRSATRSQIRETPPREPTRELPRGSVQGRNGEVLSRKRTSVGDIFAIPPELIPPGWSYQWAAISVVGNTEILLDQNLMMAENGWRPVPSSRYPGRFMPAGHTGNIVRGGQMLMERPMSLTKDALNEDIRNAKQLLSDRNDALKLSGVKKGLPDGFEMSGRQRGTGGRITMNIDRGLYGDDSGEVTSIPRPSHTLAEPGE